MVLTVLGESLFVVASSTVMLMEGVLWLGESLDIYHPHPNFRNLSSKLFFSNLFFILGCTNGLNVQEEDSFYFISRIPILFGSFVCLFSAARSGLFPLS
jgi:hypothetical protein